MAASSRGAVIAALAGNGTLTIIKTIAWLMSGSGAMLSEAIHSFADTANQFLLFMGIQRSEKPADATFHYGYGAERFFYALMSAVGIFVLGCGVTLYHGVLNLLHPHELHITWMPFAVLAISGLVEGSVLVVAIRSVWAKKGQRGFVDYLRQETDPTVLAVLFEDGVAVLGVLVAMAGMGLAAWTHNPVWDTVATLIIGALLGCVAIWLGMKNRMLILGPSLPAEMENAALDYIRSHPAVERILRSRSRVLGANNFRLSVDVDYDGRYFGKLMIDWVAAHRPKSDDPDELSEFAEDFGEQLMRLQARETKDLEEALRQKFPGLVYLDVEGD
ncbi:MAG: cation diffusion facilitator family transporter [Alphaproteobacteria bacterium]|nr:cation diffusion facilitator family transporter [Alphaproteobacteria bacterium]